MAETPVYTLPMRAIYLTTAQLQAALFRLEGVTVPVRSLAEWASTGIVPPSVDWTRQRRAPRLYSMYDVARARLVVRLRANGVSMPKVRSILAHLNAQEQDVFRSRSATVLVVDGWRAILHKPGEPGRTIPSGQFVLPLDGFIVGNLEAAQAVRRQAA
jgi:DNA-binding transcriptional MerR regulator